MTTASSIIDTDLCTGCKECVDTCPYHSIYFNDDLNLAQKCTGCAHLLDSGEWSVPRCVDSCPTGALKFGEESEFADLIAQAEVMKPELGTKPRVYYLNIPKKFIAGTVYDPIEKEVVVGATCTATPAGGGDAVAVDTDAFGDFWLKDLDDRRVHCQHRRRRLRHQDVRLPSAPRRTSISETSHCRADDHLQRRSGERRQPPAGPPEAGDRPPSPWAGAQIQSPMTGARP